MVRLKNRYLLLDILYPEPETWPPKSKSSTASPQLAIHAPTSDALSPGLLAKMIREEVAELYGDWGVGRLGGAAATGINVKYLSPATSTAIIRCPRASFRLVWSALTYMSHVPAPGPAGKKVTGGKERPCVFRVLRVSGTMRKAEEEAIRRARREIVRARGVAESSVLGDLISGASDPAVPTLNPATVKTIVDESEDEEMLDDEDD
ncbi:hypothetical protein N7468_003710 [Penicillium chermesinum]|uniref:Ribonuclease P/MRP protein subunit POP5 n=1 Tax=Penicillium chermesinum TaxID=63820 RepID=A0A9W9TRV2_9EURO|nr:uncharacterized protein N7468_003710 [Penicillium chermesinum]KAJ5239091.1 hypothetical protein N7468_003710 [Penicillium chermesinum]KAJ6164731.1 hypothetical protein N7470_003403 [Penicillium chermesinum]